jgi:hypothetical protein
MQKANITTTEALDYIQKYANRFHNGGFLEAMIYLKENLLDEPDVYLVRSFYIAFSGFQEMFYGKEAA